MKEKKKKKIKKGENANSVGENNQTYTMIILAFFYDLKTGGLVSKISLLFLEAELLNEIVHQSPSHSAKMIRCFCIKSKT